MNARPPEDGPLTLALPQGGFEAVEGIVLGLNNAFRAANGPDSERISVKQGFVLQQAASEGILGLLEQMQVGGASALATDLRTKVGADEYTDMLAVEMDARSDYDRLSDELEEHQSALTETEEAAEDAGEEAAAPALVNGDGTQTDEAAVLQLEEQMVRQQRYARLAEAVGATARATVAAMTGGNSDAVRSSIERARKTVEAVTEPVEVNGMIRLDTAVGSIAVQALTDMLRKLDNPPLKSIG
jgi:hypothetical protein